MHAALLIVNLVPIAIALYLCLLGPGQAWWRGGRSSAVPRLFARVALSAAWTSMLGLGMAAFAVFSLPRLMVINGAVTLTGYLAVARVRHEEAEPRRPLGLGVLVCLAALLLYWPPLETHFDASDSSAYLAAGVHLARSHRLSKEDPFLSLLPAVTRQRLFLSLSANHWGPPYARMRGGLIIESRRSTTVRPAFFPLPILWTAIGVDTLGARLAGAYACLFSALAVWAAWIFTRRRLGPLAAMLVATLVATNAACYWAGRFALSEPIAWFFLWAGLVALDAWEDEGLAADAWLAGLMLGAAGLTRVELLLFLALALAARRLLRATLWSRPLSAGFILALLLMVGATAAEVWLIQGAYVTPLANVWRVARFWLYLDWTKTPWKLASIAAAAVALFAVAVRLSGLRRSLLAGGLLGFFLIYAVFSSHSWLGRTTGWLVAYAGWPALALGALGMIWAWRQRHERPADGFFLLLTWLVGGLLLYNPHVFPAMPWAARRFVPLLVPAVIILAALAADRIFRRSVLAGLLAWTLLTLSVVLPARPLWGHSYYRGTYDQLAELAAALPEDGIFLIDSRLGPFLLSTPLWLAYDRYSLPVETRTKQGRNAITSIVASLAGKREVYLIKPTVAPREPIFFVLPHKISDFTLQVDLPEATATRTPRLTERSTTTISIYRLEPGRALQHRRRSP